jgi:hypothetical protein
METRERGADLQFETVYNIYRLIDLLHLQVETLHPADFTIRADVF